MGVRWCALIGIRWHATKKAWLFLNLPSLWLSGLLVPVRVREGVTRVQWLAVAINYYIDYI